MEKEKFKVAVVGGGNVGIAALKLLTQTNLYPDFEVVAVVRREYKPIPGIDVRVITDIEHLPGMVDAVIYAGPSHLVPTDVARILELGIPVVDSYDDHDKMSETFWELNAIASLNNTVAVVGAGWNPGTDPVMRIYMDALIPDGKVNTIFGPGSSKGHGTEVRSVKGVKDGISLTLPAEKYLRWKKYQSFPEPFSGKSVGNHLRDVYVVAERGVDRERIREEIRSLGKFKNDPTRVTFVTPKKLAEKNTELHGGILRTQSEIGFVEKRSHGKNSEMTAAVMIAATRACVRIHRRKKQCGAFSLAHIVPVDLRIGQTDQERFEGLNY